VENYSMKVGGIEVGGGVGSFSFYEDYAAVVKPEKSGQDLQRSREK
jgi:hypothetical protein